MVVFVIKNASFDSLTRVEFLWRKPFTSHYLEWFSVVCNTNKHSFVLKVPRCCKPCRYTWDPSSGTSCNTVVPVPLPLSAPESPDQRDPCETNSKCWEDKHKRCWSKESRFLLRIIPDEVVGMQEWPTSKVSSVGTWRRSKQNKCSLRLVQCHTGRMSCSSLWRPCWWGTRTCHRNRAPAEPPPQCYSQTPTGSRTP